MIHSENGFFNEFGGKYVAEVLRRPLDELEVAFKEAMADSSFVSELETIQRDYIGRETPLMFAERATELLGGGKIFTKFISSGRICFTLAPTRLIMLLVSAFLQSEWEKNA